MKISPDAMARPVDDELVVLHVPSGEYYSLNQVGAFVWAQIEAGSGRQELADLVADAYGIDRAIAAADVDALLRDLVDAQLVEDA